MKPVELLLSKLPNAKRHGKTWSVRCPAHDDKNPSLSIGEGEDGRALICCHAGCTPDEIVAALGLKLADLMPEKSYPPTTARPKPRATRKTKTSTTRPSATFATYFDAITELTRQYGPFAAIWKYRNTDGYEEGFVLRWNTPAGKIIRPVGKTTAGWIIGGMSEPRPLYQLSELLERTTEPVFVVEGEKCVEAVEKLRRLATTSPHGSQSASKADWTPLAGREVVILPDNDEAGAKYAGDVAGILANLTPPATVRVVRLSDAWPDLASGGDIADLFYQRVLRDDLYFFVAGRRLIPNVYLPMIELAVFFEGEDFTDAANRVTIILITKRTERIMDGKEVPRDHRKPD